MTKESKFVKNKKVCSSIDFMSLLPNEIKGLKELKEELFNVTVNLPALSCLCQKCGYIQQQFKNMLFCRPKFPCVIPDPNNSNKKLILFNPDIIKSENDFNESQKKIIADEDCSFKKHAVMFTYKDFTFDELLNFVLPEDREENVTSFETVGHIAHLNLKQSMLEYKYVIGKILLDKNKHIKTVVNKVSSIDQTFRFFKMELLAGENNMIAKLQEHGCIFKFDYSKVYWNSRLQTEHHRLVSSFKEGDVIFDTFAGVGPFAIPASKKNCTVYANDLNVESYKALIENKKLNKIDDNLKLYNLDGREFLNNIVINNIPCHVHNSSLKKYHIVMNLPAIAVEFLDVFREKYDTFDIQLKGRKDVLVHVYSFSKSKTPIVDVETMISSKLGIDISDSAKTHIVRRVAPNKLMLCTTFPLYWFDENDKECSCYSQLNKTTNRRKRPLEGGMEPIMSTESSSKVSK